MSTPKHPSSPPTPPGFRLGLEQLPSSWEMALFCLQWLFLSMPTILVLGRVLGRAWGLDAGGQTELIQRLMLVAGFTQGVQIWMGHRLPGMVGPSAVILVGVLASVAAGPQVVLGSMALGGVLLSLAGLLGLARLLARLYTPPVLASTLLLIAINLCPVIVGQLFAPLPAARAWGGTLCFGLGLTVAMIFAQQKLKGVLGSMVLLGGMVLGSLAFYALGLAPWPDWSLAGGWGAPSWWPGGLDWSLAELLSLAAGYLALASNELATVEALGAMSQAPGMDGRRRRALTVAGISGVLGGLGGAVGMVTFGTSPGLAVASRSLSRWTYLPLAGALVVLAFWPGGLRLFTLVPQPVVGAVLLTLMAQMVFAALKVLTPDGRPLAWESTMVVGTAIMTGMVVAFMPESARQAMHPSLRPLLANGFVMGLGIALFLEHVALRRKA